MNRLRKLGFGLALILLILVFQSCGSADDPNNKCGEGGTFIPRQEYNYNLDVTASLKSVGELISPYYIEGKYFCLNDTTVVFQPKRTEQPCFQLKPGQSYVGEYEYPTIRTYFEVLDPFQFSLYFRHIPPKLNKFLEIRIKNYSKLIRSIEDELNFYNWKEFSPSNLWPSGFSAEESLNIATDYDKFSLFGVLHNLVRTKEDSYIYIYLPLNIGIQTPEYKGVLPLKSGYKTEINNYANPTYRLTPDFVQVLDLSSSKELDACDSYSQVNLLASIKPSILMPSLIEYKNLVKEYLKHPTDATFPDPYVDP